MWGGGGGGGGGCQRIKPHYRSEGRRQGSSGVFGGFRTLSARCICVYSSNYVFRN